MDEIRELLHSLVHQSDACRLTVLNRQRIHAYSMVGGIASLEARLYSKGLGEHTEILQKAVNNCLSCIKSTAATGKCFKCSKAFLKALEKELASKPASEWSDLIIEAKKKHKIRRRSK